MANDDKDLDEYLKGNSELSKDYRASNSAEPSTALDKKIIIAAREAVVADRQPKIIRRPRWTVPVSIAAIITLSVSLVVTMQQETGQPLISEPTLESYEYSDTKDAPDLGALNKSAAGIKQEDIQEERFRSNAEPVQMMDAFSADSDVQELKNEARSLKPAKKVLMKEKAASSISEDEVFMEQMIPAAPAEMDALSTLERKHQLSQQEITLLKIKNLWEQGKQAEAKVLFKEFIQKNPEYSQEKLKEILSENLLNILNSK